MWEIFVGDTAGNRFAGVDTDEFLRQYKSGTRLDIPDEAMCVVFHFPYALPRPVHSSYFPPPFHFIASCY
jgi:hypothetical protein